MEVPANSQVIVKVLAMEVDCPMDYVQFGVKGQAPLMTLCPLQNVGKTYTMLPKPEGKLPITMYIICLMRKMG